MILHDGRGPWVAGPWGAAGFTYRKISSPRNAMGHRIERSLAPDATSAPSTGAAEGAASAGPLLPLRFWRQIAP
jgi:hypothetical protein